jgi:hypothetical protein
VGEPVRDDLRDKARLRRRRADDADSATGTQNGHDDVGVHASQGVGCCRLAWGEAAQPGVAFRHRHSWRVEEPLRQTNAQVCGSLDSLAVLRPRTIHSIRQDDDPAACVCGVVVVERERVKGQVDP